MQWGTFRKGARQQVCIIAAVDIGKNSRIQNVAVDRVACRASQMIVDAPAENFRTHPAMNEPLLKPDSLEGIASHAAKRAGDVRISERSKSDLVPRGGVRDTGVALRAEAKQNQERFEVRLKEDVDVHPLRQIAPIADVPWCRVEYAGRRRSAVLTR